MDNHNESLSDKHSVLIVDDSKAVRLYVEELLLKEEYKVLTAENGVDGLEIIYRQRPDLILLDVEMPRMSGIEVLDQLRADRLLSTIILFTTRSSLENRVEGLNLGADDYIVKPFEESELLARVRAGLRTTLLKKELDSARNRTENAMTRLRETQERLIAEQRLQAIASLASGVAHQITNHLSYIQGNLRTLLTYLTVLVEGAERFNKVAAILGGDEHGTSVEAIELIEWLKGAKLDYIREDIGPLIGETREGGTRIASIVDAFLVFDRVKSACEEKMEPLNDVVSSFVSIFRSCLPQGVTLQVEFDPLPETLRCHRGLLNIALENILQNAVDAVGENGNIGVNLSRDNCWCLIRICDSGGGIPDGCLDMVYEPFYSNCGISGRTGLGLTVAQFLVNAHGGRIQIDSGSLGTTVTIYLPMECVGLNPNGASNP
jgi:signal transduction histidine kinase